jgi:hypothetical protein
MLDGLTQTSIDPVIVIPPQTKTGVANEPLESPGAPHPRVAAWAGRAKTAMRNAAANLIIGNPSFVEIFN